MRFTKLLPALTCTLLLGACVYDPNMRSDFDFPMERGDINKGMQAFTDLGCHQCHSIAGVDLPLHPYPSPVHLELGGSTTYRKSEAELMTSVMNPNHMISDKYREQMLIEGAVPLDSPMPYFEYMTLGQLFDIVALLNSKYQLIEPSDES